MRHFYMRFYTREKCRPRAASPSERGQRSHSLLWYVEDSPSLPATEAQAPFHRVTLSNAVDPFLLCVCACVRALFRQPCGKFVISYSQLQTLRSHPLRPGAAALLPKRILKAAAGLARRPGVRQPRAGAVSVARHCRRPPSPHVLGVLVLHVCAREPL